MRRRSCRMRGRGARLRSCIDAVIGREAPVDVTSRVRDRGQSRGDHFLRIPRQIVKFKKMRSFLAAAKIDSPAILRSIL